MSKHPEYDVRLRVLPDDSIDGDGYRRLRAFLKSAARSWRLLCTSIRPAPTGNSEAGTVVPNVTRLDTPEIGPIGQNSTEATK